MIAVWFCRCPEVIVDDDGHCWPCRIIARVADLQDFDSTSGPVLVAVVQCPASLDAPVLHRNHVLYDDLDLLG